MGSVVSRLLLDKGVEIVGATARSPEKLGIDLGHVAGLGREVGVTVEIDPEKVFRHQADVAIVSVGSYLDTMAEHFRLCLQHGVNVVTIEEETVYPWTTAPELARELDTVAREYSVTLAASGAQDVFWMKQVAVLMGAAHRIDVVRGRCSWNADDYGPAVAAHVHLGQQPEAFRRHVQQHGWPDFVARATLEALVADTRLTVREVSSAVEPVIATADTPSRSMGGLIAAGDMLGVIDRTTIHTVEGPSFEFEMAGRVYVEGEVDRNEWEIHGEPNLHLRNDAVPTRLITCTTVVNRIPDVINAEPGLVTLDRLPQPRYRHHKLDTYVTRPTQPGSID